MDNTSRKYRDFVADSAHKNQESSCHPEFVDRVGLTKEIDDVQRTTPNSPTKSV